MGGEAGGKEEFVLMDLISVDGLEENCCRIKEAVYVGNEGYVGQQC